MATMEVNQRDKFNPNFFPCAADLEGFDACGLPESVDVGEEVGVAVGVDVVRLVV
jgi:hypothetical protein